MGQFADMAADRAQEAAFHRRTAFAHLAHAVEVMHLGRIVLGFLGQVEQRVVDVLEGVAHPLLQALAGDAAHGTQQLADALAGRVQALAQIDDSGWITGFVHRQTPEALRCAAEPRTGRAGVDDKAKRVSVSCAGIRLEPPVWLQAAGKPVSWVVPMPSSGNITGMPSSIR